MIVLRELDKIIDDCAFSYGYDDPHVLRSDSSMYYVAHIYIYGTFYAILMLVNLYI